MKLKPSKIILFAAVLCFFGNFSYGQRLYSGSYSLFANYTTHYYSTYPYKGTFGAGVMTIGSTGAASYTATFNFNGYDLYFTRIWSFTGRGRGVVNSRGSFTFNNGVRGSGVILGTTIGALGGGTFLDSVGNGAWFASRYR